MFGIGFSELLVIMVVSLLLFGPDKLPEAARSLGKFMALVKRNSDALRREFYNTVYEPAEDLKKRVDLSARELMSLADIRPEEMNCEQRARKEAEDIAKANQPAETPNNTLPSSEENIEKKDG